ncbi:MAG: GNAT family protein [Aquiluna sp.]|nr:GNAT family protein [Aquiluna sp.]
MILKSTKNQFNAPVGTPITQNDQALSPNAAAAIAGSKCDLVPLDASKHGEGLYEAFQGDDDLWNYLPQGPFDNSQDFLAWIENVQGQQDPVFYSIIDKGTGKAVGVSSYLRIDLKAKSIEVGWLTFSSRMQKSSLATEAMYLMMKNAFELGFRRYEWKCNALNQPSISAAHRLGMSFEGVFRQATIVKGHNRDTAWFSIIDTDWPEAKSAFESWLSAENFDASGNQIMRLSDLTAPLVKDRWPNLRVEIES